MMAKDSEWAWLLERLEKIPHLQRLRIHSRFACRDSGANYG